MQLGEGTVIRSNPVPSAPSNERTIPAIQNPGSASATGRERTPSGTPRPRADRLEARGSGPNPVGRVGTPFPSDDTSKPVFAEPGKRPVALIAGVGVAVLLGIAGISALVLGGGGAAATPTPAATATSIAATSSPTAVETLVVASTPQKATPTSTRGPSTPPPRSPTPRATPTRVAVAPTPIPVPSEVSVDLTQETPRPTAVPVSGARGAVKFQAGSVLGIPTKPFVSFPQLPGWKCKQTPMFDEAPLNPGTYRVSFYDAKDTTCKKPLASTEFVVTPGMITFVKLDSDGKKLATSAAPMKKR